MAESKAKKWQELRHEALHGRATRRVPRAERDAPPAAEADHSDTDLERLTAPVTLPSAPPKPSSKK